jgi:NTE family protein
MSFDLKDVNNEVDNGNGSEMKLIYSRYGKINLPLEVDQPRLFRSRINGIIKDTAISNPYIFLKSDTQNDKDFPTRGIYINAEGKVIDLLKSEVEKRLVQVKADIRINIPFKTIYLLNLYGGITIGENLPHFYNTDLEEFLNRIL